MIALNVCQSLFCTQLYELKLDYILFGGVQRCEMSGTQQKGIYTYSIYTVQGETEGEMLK